VYEGFTDEEGFVRITLPPDKQLGPDEQFEVRPYDTTASGYLVYPVAQDNTSVTLAVMIVGFFTVPVAGVLIRAVFEDHGRGGTFSLTTI
jgi:hypothetical protein